MESRTVTILYAMWVEATIQTIKNLGSEDPKDIHDTIHQSIAYGRRDVIREVLKNEFGKKAGDDMLNEWTEQARAQYGRRNGEKIFVKNILEKP